MTDYVFAVLGAGIAGASVACELQAHGRVVLLEREPLPGHHTTGRSAAVLVQNYGNAVVRRLTQASREFFEREDQRVRLAEERKAGEDLGVDVRLLDAAATRSLCPVLREDYVAGGLLEPGAKGIDVAGMLEGFLRGLRERGGAVRTRADVVRVEPSGEAA